MNGMGFMGDGLRDIRGLDPVSFWPLAPGWWLILGGVLFVAVMVIGWRKLSPHISFGRPRDWRVDARWLVRDLRRRLPTLDGRIAASEFSELMRRIAMARTSRDECAGLSGRDWLDWLSDNDPAGFDWVEHGRLLIDIPYAPPGITVDMDDLRRMLDAAGGWIEQGEPTQTQQAPEPVREAA